MRPSRTTRLVGVGIVLDHKARVLAFGQPSGETSPREFADGDLDRYHSGSPLIGHPIPLVGEYLIWGLISQ